MRVQTQIRSICPAWAKQLASNPKTPVASHRPNSGEMCKHNCGFAFDSWWVYQWIDFNEIQAFMAGAADPDKCQLCAAVARPGKRLCDSCSDLETSRPIEGDAAPAQVKRRGRQKKEAPPAPPAPPVMEVISETGVKVIEQCFICGESNCSCMNAPVAAPAVPSVEDLL